MPTVALFIRFLKKAGLFACFLLLSKSGIAQTAAPHFRRFGPEDGLPSATVHQILQDKTGLIWVATTNGLARFDGYRFRVFGQKEGLTDDVIASIDQSPDGQIWVLTNSGLVFSILGDSLRPCPCNPKILARKSQFRNPHRLLFDEKMGLLHLAFGGLGILQIAPDGSREQVIKPENPRDLLVMKIGDRWLSEFQAGPENEENATPSASTGLEIHADGAVRRIDGLKRFLPKIRLGLALPMGKNSVLAWRDGFFYRIENDRVVEVFQFDKRILWLEIGTDGSLLMASPDFGLRRYASFDHLRTGIFENWLSTQARHFFRDKNGGLWVGSLSEGLFYTPAPTMKTLADGQPNPVFQSQVATLSGGPGGSLLAGFINGNELNIDFNTLKISQLPDQDPPTGMVNSLVWHQMTATIWAGKRSLDFLENGSWKTLMMPGPKADAKPCRAVSRVRFSPDGRRIWACSRQYFVEIDAETRLVIDHSMAHGLKESFEDILETRDGQVWIGNGRGLFLWKNKKLEPRNGLHESLKTGVTSLFERRDGSLAIATKTGLLLQNPATKAPDFFTTENGLPDNQIGSMTEDSLGRLWGSSFGGGICLEFLNEKWTVRRFTTAHGLPSNLVSSILFQAGKVWFGTSRGLSFLEMANLPPIRRAAPPVFLEMKINQKPLTEADFLAANGLQFICQHDENNHHFRFSNFDFATGGHTIYRYRLAENQPWQTTGQPEISFFSLSPGRYSLEMEAAGPEGDWSEPLIWPFEIRPPFWQTWWFRSLIFGLIVGPLVAFFRYRLKNLRREMASQNERNELEKQAMRAQMDPHFIFNSLNSVQEFILKNDRLRAADFLSRFARLMRQSLDQSFRSRVSLETELDYLKNYLSLEADRFGGAFRFEFEIDPGLDLFDLELPAMLLQPFVENAILHGVRGKSGDGLIRLVFEPFGKSGLRICIEDNGPGLHQQQPDAPSKTHKSVATSLARRRVAAASSHPEAAILMENRLNEEGQIIGARVVITLPEG